MDDAERAAWLERRRQGIGSSDIAAIAGLCPYRDAASVYADKHGLVPHEQSLSMLIGTLLEDDVAELYRQTIAVSEPERAIYIQRPLWNPIVGGEPWQLASPDYYVYEMPPGGNPIRLLECKTSATVGIGGNAWGATGTQEIPPNYLAQVQWQMAVTEASECDVAVLIAGRDFRLYRIPACGHIQSALYEIASNFWRVHVLAGLPPAPDWNRTGAAHLAQRLHGLTRGREVELGAAELELAYEVEDLGRQIAALQARRDEARGKLVLALGDAEVGVLPGGRRCKRYERDVPERVTRAHKRREFRILKAESDSEEDGGDERQEW